MFLFVPGVISQQTDADCGEDVHTGNRMLRLLPKVTRQRMGRPWSDVCYCSVDFVVLRLVQVNELNCVQTSASSSVSSKVRILLVVRGRRFG